MCVRICFLASIQRLLGLHFFLVFVVRALTGDTSRYEVLEAYMRVVAGISFVGDASWFDDVPAAGSFGL